MVNNSSINFAESAINILFVVMVPMLYLEGVISYIKGRKYWLDHL